MNMQPSADFATYFAEFSGPQRQRLDEIYDLLRSLLPDAEEAMSYQIPTFKLEGKNIVHFAGYPKHIGFYPSPAVISEFELKLKNFKYAKGSVQFPMADELPTTLIKEMVALRLVHFEASGR
jgi:uncharacterized protein YdhG (YjbR/CyaY superfamily)